MKRTQRRLWPVRCFSTGLSGESSLEELSMLARLSLIALLVVSFTLARDARAECNCVSVAGDVTAAVQAEVAKADGLYARGDFSAALEIYAKAYATSKDSALLY